MTGMCVFCGLVAFALLITHGTSSTILEKMEADPDLSQFCYMIKNYPEAKFTLEFKSVTLFAPINSAFQRFRNPITDKDFYLTLYHMVSMPHTTDQLGGLNILHTELEGHPPLWVTVRVGTYHDDVYVNNARVLLNQSNIKGKYNGKDQIIHKIDRLLIPTTSPKSVVSGLANPNALDFLNQFESLEINPFRVRTFRQRVHQLHKEELFRTLGSHTFFIPIDEGNYKGDLIDNKTIDGHLIPKKVLFTASTKLDLPYETAANGDNLKVYITFYQEPEDKTEAIYVKSETKVGDARHSPGVVIAEIVKANIPVSNGVIHLIQKPLMVVDTTVKQFLQEKGDGPLSKFVEVIADNSDVGKEFLRAIERARDVTLFAPSNAAWNDENLRNVIGNQQRMREILMMHIVIDARLTKDQIIKNNKRQVYQAQTLNKKNNLYFNVATSGENSTLTVEGGGVNATVIQANIAATNGIIHIIDRVLGVPYTTVLDKLQQDPMLNETFNLGRYGGFNAQLSDAQKRFTYFVPRDKAWTDARVALPSPVKKLFMKEFAYYAQQILERHLVQSDTVYTMEKIKQLSEDASRQQAGLTTFGMRKEVELQSQRGLLKIAVEERPDHTFIIHWRGQKIPVFRHNVECTNGIIHVIDFPFLQEDDIRVIKDSATAIVLAPHLLMLILVKSLLL